jgi:UDP-glucose 4-epimerase
MISGSLALLRAAKGARTRKLVLASTTDVYGALATNPQYISEDAPLRGGAQSYYLEERIHVEEMFQKYERTGRDRVVTILRPCTILGSTISNFKTNFLQQPVIPTVLGFDPLVQFVHESDVLRAFIMVIERDAPGAYNIVGEGVMPLSRAIRIARKPSVPLPEFLLGFFADIAWNMNVGFAPSRHVPFLKYPCVADGDKARHDLGFVPVYTSQEAFLSFAGREPEFSRSS